MMEKNKNYLQNQKSNSNYIKNHHHNNNSYNSNQINTHYIQSTSNEINSNKIISLKCNFKADNRMVPVLKNNSNEIIYNTHNKDNIHENIAKKYYSNNNSNKSIKNVNQDTKSNYSFKSNSSSNTIKSMLNQINTGAQKNDEFSFQKIKCKKYPIESLDSSRESHEGNYQSKCISTNFSLTHDTQHNLHKGISNQNKDSSDPKINLIIKQKIRNSCLFINDGPILIDLENYHKNVGKNNSNNFIKFSQLRIVYNDSKVNKDKKITTLFKLHPSTFLELEDCDIGFQTPSKKKSDNNEKKSVAFLLSSNKIPENNDNTGNNINIIQINNNSILNPTILNLTNTRIHNFYQSIRAGQNCIINITKSACLQNYGKAIVMINPISLKINEAFFQNNMELVFKIMEKQ